MSERLVRIMTGLITLTLAASLIVFGVLVGAGKLAPKYHISGTFSSAGQGLLPGSDVKVHGINIGQVTGVRLVKGKARVGMKIEKGEKVPADSSATIRPKTLFGEKFVDIDPGPNEARGPFLKSGDVIRKTVGGFELERVLTDLYPILKAIRPEELTVVLDTLAQGGAGLGDRINRQIPPVVRALTEFFQVLAEAGNRIPCPQQGLPAGLECPAGSTLAAIKFVVGGEPLCGRGLSCAPGSPVAASTGQASVGPASRAPRRVAGGAAGPSHGAGAVLGLHGRPLPWAGTATEPGGAPQRGGP